MKFNLIRAVNSNRQLIARLLASVLACAAAPGALAADFPDRPIRLIVPSAPGGGTDTTMRIISPKLGEVLGQRIILDNRPGQSGNIGVEIASRAAPDGYTLAAMIASNASNPAVMKTVPYNLERDFAAVSLVVVMPNVLTVHPSLPVGSVKELVALAKARPGELQFASPGFGSTAHLAMELLMSLSGTRMIHIPYKSGGAAFISVQSGEMPMMFGNVMNSLQHVHSGRYVGDLRDLVDVGQYRYFKLFSDLIQNLQTFIHPHATKGFYGCPVSLIVGRLVNEGHSQAGTNFLEFTGGIECQVAGFDYAGTRYQE